MSRKDRGKKTCHLHFCTLTVSSCRASGANTYLDLVQTGRPHQNEASKLLSHSMARTGSALLPLCQTHPSFYSERQEIDSSSQVWGGCQFFAFQMQPGSCQSTSEVPTATPLWNLNFLDHLSKLRSVTPVFELWLFPRRRVGQDKVHGFFSPIQTLPHCLAVSIPFLSQELLTLLEIVNLYFKVLFGEHFSSELWQTDVAPTCHACSNDHCSSYLPTPL